MQESIFCSKTR